MAFSSLPHRFGNLSREARESTAKCPSSFQCAAAQAGLSMEIVRGLSSSSRSRIAHCHLSRPVAAATRHGHSPTPLSRSLPDTKHSLPHSPSGYGYVADESAKEFLALHATPYHQPTCYLLHITKQALKSHSSCIRTRSPPLIRLHQNCGGLICLKVHLHFHQSTVISQVLKPSHSLSTDRASPPACALKSEPSMSPRWCRDGRTRVFGDGGRIGVPHARR
jgi:hypothetical protein